MSRFLYTLVLYLALPAVLVRIGLRASRDRRYLRHIDERFALGAQACPGDGPLIWIHAVSVGETRAASPLVEALRAKYPECRILLTQMTPTGRETADKLFGDRICRRYLPYDYPFAVRRFLRQHRPALGILMETEIWPNLIHEAARLSIPLTLVNARLSPKSLAGYRKFHGLMSDVVRRLSLVCAQTDDDARRFTVLGARRVAVTGNLKYDMLPPAEQITLARRLRRLWGKERLIFLAASTRPGEEELILDALGNVHSDFVAVIVPRHPERFEEVASLLLRNGLDFRRRSAEDPLPADCRFVLGDSLGEMYAYYAAADMALIGGSLLPFGSQNLIEACAVGTPVILGPSIYNFQQAAEQAIARGAALPIAGAWELPMAIERLASEPDRRMAMCRAAMAFAGDYRGAVEQILDQLAPFLPADRQNRFPATKGMT